MPIAKGPAPLKMKVKTEYRQKVTTKPPVKPAELHHKEDFEPSFATENLSDEELRLAVQKVLPLNLGSLFLSVIGLMMVIVGIFLG